MQMLVIAGKSEYQQTDKYYTLCLNPQHIKRIFTSALNGETIIETIDGEQYCTPAILADTIIKVNEALS